MENLKSKISREIYHIVEAIQPYDEIESNHISDTLRWIKSGQPIFRMKKPDIPNKHLVVYFVLLDPGFQKILLVDHKKAGLWLPTGGHVEIGELPSQAVQRECFEELQIQANFYVKQPLFLTSTVTIGQTAGHVDVSLWYILEGNCERFYSFDKEEFNDIRWFDFKEIPYNHSDPHMKRFIDKLKATLLH